MFVCYFIIDNLADLQYFSQQIQIFRLIFHICFGIVIIAFGKQATIAQVVERNIGNVEVTGPTPVSSFYFLPKMGTASHCSHFS